ncbi:unnamed protein product, partial [Brugia timori]|uniref:Uncharacterized protein n=1 Tax=Brugia timori TaxID=42155 RepID=A0A0R3QLC8_9BILA
MLSRLKSDNCVKTREGNMIEMLKDVKCHRRTLEMSTG